MKKLILLLAVFLLLIHPSVSQSCLPDGITFTTQEQIDSFPINYPFCTEIEGSVLICGMDINNIDSLNQLSTIDRDLSISLGDNTQLVFLTGLDNLDTIRGTLRFWSNDSLKSIQGLNNLVYIGEDLNIGPTAYGLPNYSLNDISGLSKLNHIEGYLLIDRNLVLKNIDGLSNLTYVGNTGVSFGLFKGVNWLFLIISFLALVFFMSLYSKNKKYRLQLSIICAGIIGNLIDRIFIGYVVDFLDFRIWPIFNVADSATFIGTIWLVILLIKNKEDLKIR